MKRKIYDKLSEWKSRPHKALVVKGQRQVGKTYIIDLFGKENYTSYLYVNLADNKKTYAVFENDSDVDSIISDLSVFYREFTPVPGKTLIFLDEVQECPRARSLLKAFTIDGRYDVIASGSLLGVAESRLGTFSHNGVPPLLPIGYEEHLELRSMDFEEFLWARNYPLKKIDHVKQCIKNKTPLDEIEFQSISEEFRNFMRVGGMPEAVYDFTNNGYASARRSLKSILDTCKGDINRYNTGVDILKTGRCFDDIPDQLAESNKRFTYSRIDNNNLSRSSAEKYMENLLWIEASGYGNYCRSLTQVEKPLERNTCPDVFKVYLSDTGMLVCMYDDDTEVSIYTNDLSCNRGAIAENVVAECLAKNDIIPRYYRKSNGTNKMELDFVVMLGSELTIIEVKSGKTREYPSIKKATADRRIILEDANISIDREGIEHYPLFCAAFIREMQHDKDMQTKEGVEDA